MYILSQVSDDRSRQFVAAHEFVCELNKMRFSYFQSAFLLVFQLLARITNQFLIMQNFATMDASLCLIVLLFSALGTHHQLFEVLKQWTLRQLCCHHLRLMRAPKKKASSKHAPKQSRRKAALRKKWPWWPAPAVPDAVPDGVPDALNTFAPTYHS